MSPPRLAPSGSGTTQSHGQGGQSALPEGAATQPSLTLLSVLLNSAVLRQEIVIYIDSTRGVLSLFGLTRLSVWWLRLGIDIQRIKPGNPQQNGRHERMHLTLKQEATKPASKNFLQ